MYTEQKNNVVNKLLENSGLKAIYTKEDGTSVVGTWSKDCGTMGRKLTLALAYANGEVSSILEYSPSKLIPTGKDKAPKALSTLGDMAGLTSADVLKIYQAILEKKDTLPVQIARDGKCSVLQAQRELTVYVTRYKEPEKVFIDGEYGCIKASYLKTVIEKLNLGYEPLELERNFKFWGLIRFSERAEHLYTFKIKRHYYFSFKLADLDSEEGGEQA